MDKTTETQEFAGLTFHADFAIFSSVIVLEKLVKPPVRKAPAGAFRYFQR